MAKSRSPKIGSNTLYDVCSERMTAFGELLPLVKFLDMIYFKEVFDEIYVSPSRKTILGCYRMVLGLLMMLFVGFQRIGHIKHLREDVMMAGILKVAYNLWCWLKLVVGHHRGECIAAQERTPPGRVEVIDQTIRLTRLKMVLLPPRYRIIVPVTNFIIRFMRAVLRASLIFLITWIDGGSKKHLGHRPRAKQLAA